MQMFFLHQNVAQGMVVLKAMEELSTCLSTADTFAKLPPWIEVGGDKVPPRRTMIPPSPLACSCAFGIGGGCCVLCQTETNTLKEWRKCTCTQHSSFRSFVREHILQIFGWRRTQTPFGQNVVSGCSY